MIKFREDTFVPPILELVAKETNLTVGKQYEQMLPRSTQIVFNVCVRNDLGEPQFVVYNKFKKVTK